MSDPSPQPENPTPLRQPRRRSSPGRRPLTQAQSRSLATWIFGGLFVAFLFAVFAFAPPALPVFKQRILAISSALVAGLFVYFLTGDLGVSIQGGKGKLGRLGVKSAGGAAAFVLVLFCLSCRGRCPASLPDLYEGLGGEETKQKSDDQMKGSKPDPAI